MPHGSQPWQKGEASEGAASPPLPLPGQDPSLPSLADLAPLPLLGFSAFPEEWEKVFIFTTSLLHLSLQAQNNISFITTEEKFEYFICSLPTFGVSFLPVYLRP